MKNTPLELDGIEHIKSNICLSMDLDNTLQIGTELSTVAIEIIELFLKNKIPWVIVTARSMLTLSLDFLDQLKSKSEVTAIKTEIELKLFDGLIKLLTEKSIKVPVICTTYDPCLEEKNQGLYYLEYDKMVHLYLKLIKKLEQKEITRKALIEKVTNIISMLQNGKTKEFKLDAIEEKEMWKLVFRERQLSSQFFPKSGPPGKLHQFPWIQKLIPFCNNIFHVDDFLKALEPFNIHDMDDISLHPTMITYVYAPWLQTKNNYWVDVYGIPFCEKNREKILKILTQGIINVPILEIIKQLDEQHTCYSICCFFLEVIKRKNQTVNYIKSILTDCLIPTDPIHGESKSKQESIRDPLLPRINLYFFSALASTLKNLPFERLLSSPHLETHQRAQLLDLQAQLNDFLYPKSAPLLSPLK